MNPSADAREILCTLEETPFWHKHRHAESDIGYERVPLVDDGNLFGLRAVRTSVKGFNDKTDRIRVTMCGCRSISPQSLTSAPTGVVQADDPRRSFHRKGCLCRRSHTLVSQCRYFG